MMEPEQQERMEREQEEGDIRHEDLAHNMSISFKFNCLPTTTANDSHNRH